MKVGTEWKQTAVKDVSLTLRKKGEDPRFMVRHDVCSSEEEELLSGWLAAGRIMAWA